MPLRSINELHKETGIMRDTISRRLGDLQFTSTGKGRNAAKRYDSKAALPLIYGAGQEGKPNPQAAATDLSVARREQIALDMECKRKERIPLDEIGAVNDEIFSQMAGALKDGEGKVMTAEFINDLFGQLREVAARVRELAR